MRLRRALLAFAAAAAAVLLVVGGASAGGVLDDYQTRYTKTSLTSDREDVIKKLAATGKVEALKALQYCAGVSKAIIEESRDKTEKLRPKFEAARAKLDAKFRDYAEQQKKLGRPTPTSFPDWPEFHEFLQAQADVEQAEKAVFSELMILSDALDAHGAVVAGLSPEAQAAVRADWTKNRLAVKDWAARAECYQILGHTPTDWAFDMLAAAVATQESDPRALTSAIDGLCGRDPAKAVPVLVGRIDDVRWTVRVAVVAALENTPSKDGIDAIVKRMAKEDGRLLADCCRALKALTGHDAAANPEVWRVWWTANREKWTGKPKPVDPDAPVNPFKSIGGDKPKEDDPSKKTGFFGIEIESKRVVFVIDVSGSMNEAMGGSGPEGKLSKAVLAKRELKQALAALPDGAMFDLIFFATGVRVWKPEMQKSDAKIRKEAQDYVDAAEVVGGTSTYDALEAAFSLGDVGKGKKREADPTGDARMDTIVLLSDGKPTEGRTTDPDAIRAAVREWNKARRVVVNSIAFGAGAKDGADPKFMRGLAEDSGGAYVAK